VKFSNDRFGAIAVVIVSIINNRSVPEAEVNPGILNGS